MMEKILDKIRCNRDAITLAFLWLCIWATYNTDISRFYNPGFPHNFIDLIHGLRSLLPFVALIISIIILFRNRFSFKKNFHSPLGCLLVFSIVGIFASIFSKNPLMAFYWGLLYCTVIIYLLTILKKKNVLKKIIVINLIIASTLAIALTVFFFIQPGSLNSLTYNFLICNQRPYESLGSVQAASQTFGVFGTRPTGLGRYAGFMAVASIAGFFFFNYRQNSKLLWFISCLVFILILFFAKGRTEILGFLAAIVFLLWLYKKINFKLIICVVLIFIVAALSIFYNVPCTNNMNLLSFFWHGDSLGFHIGSSLELKNNISTLSGRTNGVWLSSLVLFYRSPIMGLGFQADRFFLGGQHSHNSIIHSLIQTGILGTSFFILAFILLAIMLIRLLKSKEISKEDKDFLMMIFAVLIFFGVRSITESVAFFSADWLFVAPMIAYIQCLNSEVRKKQSNNKETKINFLGNKIDALKISDVTEKMSNWIKDEPEKMHWIIVTGMHGIVEAEKNAGFKHLISSADLFVPDGISLVWLSRLKGFDVSKRISGADLTAEFFKVSEKNGFSQYFYGDTDETLQALNQKLSVKFKDLKIAGSYSPPFRELTESEDELIIEKINNAKPDVLWVGLGLPKQEKWIFEHRDKLNVPIVIGVGAAFKFLSGRVKRAPKWIGNFGFEWLWRLFHEPKTVWKRVFIDGPFFCWLVVRDFFA